MGVSLVERGICIKTLEDVKKLERVEEKEFARLLFDRLKEGSRIEYESTMFQCNSEHGKNGKATVPDFKVSNFRTGRVTYIEITTSSETKNPKQRQKDVIKEVAPEERYVVLYKEHLNHIQEKHSEYNLLKRKNGK